MVLAFDRTGALRLALRRRLRFAHEVGRLVHQVGRQELRHEEAFHQRRAAADPRSTRPLRRIACGGGRFGRKEERR